MLEFRCGWFGVVSVLQAEAYYINIFTKVYVYSIVEVCKLKIRSSKLISNKCIKVKNLCIKLVKKDSHYTGCFKKSFTTLKA